MTQDTVVQLLKLAANKEAANNALRASGCAIDRMHKGAIWKDEAHGDGCHAFIDLDALLKQSGSFALEPWMNQFEGMLEQLFGEDIYCAVTPLIVDTEEGRHVDLHISLDGISSKEAKSVLQGVYSTLPTGMKLPLRERSETVLAFPTNL